MDSFEEFIRLNKIIYGYKVDNEILPVNGETIDFMYNLSQEDFESYTMANITKATIVKNVESFFDDQIILREVFCVDEFDAFRLHGQKIKSLSMLIVLYNHLGKVTHPFKIPVDYESDDSYYGLTEVQIPICDEEYFLKNINIYFNRIILSRNITPIVGVCYTHELTHTQLVGNKGIVRDFYNMELLPIFMELLYAYKTDSSFRLFKTILAQRISYLLCSFDEIFKYNEENKDTKDTKVTAMLSSKYIISILKAFNLFSNFIYGSQKLKREVMEWIQKVFDGLICLEEMLNHFEISDDEILSLGKVLSLKRIC